MSELRQNIVTRDWVIIAADRARRPEAFVLKRPQPIDPPSYVQACPFCPGNEAETGKEIWNVGGPEGWNVRLVRNRFPVVMPEGIPARKMNGIHRSMNAVGHHEVLVEHRDHSAHPPMLQPGGAALIAHCYARRYRELRADPRVESIVIFRNHGYGAGTSQPHPHSQIVGLPVVPSHMRSRLEIAMRYFDESGECVYCRTVKDERISGERIVLSSRHFLAFIPFAALAPFHTWVFPLRHTSSFGDTTEDELKDLSGLLRTLLRKLYRGLNDPDYNMFIRSLPTHLHHTDHFHWYLSIVPRLTIQAGFEMGSGMYVNPSIPEESAAFLRDVKEEE